MTDTLNYDLIREEEVHTITITPQNTLVPGGDIFITGIFRLTEGEVGMGDIVFDEQLATWHYEGLGDITIEEAEEIAEFIKDRSKRIM